MAKIRLVFLLVFIVAMMGCGDAKRHQIVTVHPSVLPGYFTDMVVLLDTRTGETWYLDARYIEDNPDPEPKWRKLVREKQ